MSLISNLLHLYYNTLDINVFVIISILLQVADLEPTLKLLEEQNVGDTETWETRYCLLLWLSIIVMIPFHMARLDSGAQSKTVMNR